jgi:5,10-methylenetetrahydromethanopterin reductase
MRYGISLHLTHPLREMVPLAAQAERSGFDNVWIADHYFLRDTFMALALIANATSRITLGPSVANAVIRHPAVIASAAATLNEYSNGRCVLGLGTGGYELETELKIARTRQISALAESIKIIRRLNKGLTVNFKGSSTELMNCRLKFRADAPLPIYLGARGERSMQLAASLADGLITNGTTEPYLRFVSDVIRKGRPARKDFQLCVVAPIVLDTDVRRARLKARRGCVYMAGGEYSTAMLRTHGLNVEDLEPLRRAVRGGVTSAARYVPEAAVESFAVAGSKADCAEKIAKMAKSGLDQIVSIPVGDDVAEKSTAVRKIGEFFSNLKASL